MSILYQTRQSTDQTFEAPYCEMTAGGNGQIWNIEKHWQP